MKASRTNFSTRKRARVYVQQGALDKGIFVYVLNSCGLVKVVKKSCSSVRGFIDKHKIYPLPISPFSMVTFSMGSQTLSHSGGG